MHGAGETMGRRGKKLEDWEVSLVKTMLAKGKWSKQDIHAHFSHPDRPINQARISQIASGVIHQDIPIATDAQLHAFLEKFRNRFEVQQSFFDIDPLHAVSFAERMQLKLEGVPAVTVEENDWTEFKETFNWNARARYARTMAAFANNRGGYLIFGVRDDTRQIVGMRGNNFATLDSATAAHFFDDCLSPALRWDMRQLRLGGAEVGVIYTWPAGEKPVICTKNQDDVLKAADIYYRYVGNSRRIGYPELMQILSERDRRVEQKWMQTVTLIQDIGIDSAAILDPRSGKVTGPTGTFLIDERLIPKLSFIREGEFSPKQGEPTLKLIGTLERVHPEGGDTLARVEHMPIHEREIIAAFIEGRRVLDPIAYVRQLCHIQSLWVPVYYFVSMAEKSIADVAETIKSEATSYPRRRDQQVVRLTKGIGPPKPSAQKNKPGRDRVCAKDHFDTAKAAEALMFMKAVQTLCSHEIDFSYVLQVLQSIFKTHYGVSPRLTNEIRYTATGLDYEFWGPSPGSAHAARGRS
jgi:hypothetical protein